MNTITKAWCNFTGWAANCWETIDDQPYFGGDGVVCKAWNTSTYDDNGVNINGIGIQAFNYFGSRGVKKYFTRARLSLFTNGTPAIGVGINVDFQTQAVNAPLSFTPTSYGLWGTGLWGSAIWGSGVVINNTWLGVTGIGYCGAVSMSSATMGMQVQWASTDIVYQTGWAGV
jgi:hypothetical protein